jgi:hypothetical protein
MMRARLLHAGVTLALLAAFAFVVVAPPESCPPVSAAEIRGSAQAGVDWFVRNQNADGTWLYLYDAEANSTPSEYNPVRHAGVAMGLYQAAAAGLPGALRSADRGTEWALDRLVERDGRVATGSSALLAAGLVIRREASGDQRYDDLLRRLGRFLLAQTEPSGAVLAEYDPERGEPVPGEYSKYFTGEAYWALARLHRNFTGEGWGEAADRIGAYLATSRDEAEDHWPPIPDHWAAYGMAETVHFPERGRPPLTQDEVDYARSQLELFGPQARWISQRFGPWGKLVRGTYTPRGGGYGVTSEALTGWWLTALEEPRLAGLREPIAERATCMAALAIRAQADREDAAGAARPDAVEGAWFIDGETRMDDQQHALAGLLRTIPIVEASAASGGAGDDAPTAWLWLAALVLALNPARAAFGVLRGVPSARAGPRKSALRGAIGGLVVCAVAAAADPLLDLLDVSDPSFRTAAGLVAVLTGVADVFRRPPPSEAALAVARPAVLILAVGAGADHGVLLTAAAMAIGVALVTALVARARPDDGPSDRALRWTARLLAAGLVACGVILTLDGILDV